jgi:hypothetical protein
MVAPAIVCIIPAELARARGRSMSQASLDGSAPQSGFRSTIDYKNQSPIELSTCLAVSANGEARDV